MSEGIRLTFYINTVNDDEIVLLCDCPSLLGTPLYRSTP